MRIVAGTARGRRIDAPAGTATRPTSDRVREAVFNALDSRGAVAGARVVDLFAGSGALGIEALSRGAEHATFVERDGRTAAVVRANVERLGFEDRATVVVADAWDHARTMAPADLVLCDPPHVFDRWNELLSTLPARFVVAESDREVDPGEGRELVRAKRYGSTFVTIVSTPPSARTE